MVNRVKKGAEKKKSKARRGATLDQRAVQWEEVPVPAAQFLRMRTLPQVVKLNGGDYSGDFGSGTHVDVNQPFLLHTARSCTKVFAELVTWDPERDEHVTSGGHIVIPTNYPGWFWPVSSEGTDLDISITTEPEASGCVRDIDFDNTSQVLSTATLPCFRQQAGLAPSGQRLYSPVRLDAGAILTLGDRYVERTTRRVSCCPGALGRPRVKQVEYVLAQDASRADLLLPVNAKGRFYRIADSAKVREHGCCDSGAVYRVSDLLTTPLPKEGVVVRLIHGQAPASLRKFSGLLRMREVYTEQTVIVCSLGAHAPRSLLEFPVDSDIEYIAAINNDALLNSPGLETAIEYCLEEVLNYIVSLKVIQNFYPLGQGSVDEAKGEKRKQSPSPPPLPLLGPEEKEEEDVGVDKYKREPHSVAPSDTDADQSHYETIPFDKHKRALTSQSNPQVESEYLVPVKAQSAIYSNVSNKLNRHTSNASSCARKSGPDCPANSIINGTDDFKIKPLTYRETSVLKTLPPVGRERMDRFLQDSLEELNRIRLNDDPSEKSPLRSQFPAVGKPPVVSPKPHVEMKAKLDAYLDEIFDCADEKDTEDCVTTSNMHGVTTEPALRVVGSPGGGGGGGGLGVAPPHHLVRSASATIYPSSPTPFSDWHTPPPRKTSGNRPETEVNADSGSSCRSASDIYRQLSLGYLASGARWIGSGDSPYARADSGIVVWRPGEQERGVYRALSEAGWRPPASVEALSVEEVAASLLYLGLSPAAAHAFNEQQIDGHLLSGMDAAILAEAFPQLNTLERKKVLDFIAGWRPKKLVQ